MDIKINGLDMPVIMKNLISCLEEQEHVKITCQIVQTDEEETENNKRTEGTERKIPDENIKPGPEIHG